MCVSSVIFLRAFGKRLKIVFSSRCVPQGIPNDSTGSHYHQLCMCVFVTHFRRLFSVRITIVVKLSIGRNELAQLVKSLAHYYQKRFPLLSLVTFFLLPTFFGHFTYLCNVPFGAAEVDKCHADEIGAVANGDSFLLECVL